MAQREVITDKWFAVKALRAGDVIKLTTGEVAEFIKAKQKNFDAIIDGKLYSIPMNMFLEVQKKANPQEKAAEYTSLKKGEAFYLNKNGHALLFTFVGMEGGRIIGINPVNKGRTRIDVGLYGGKVSDLV